MILKRIRNTDGSTVNSDVEIDRIEFEIEEERYVLTEEHGGFFRIRKSDDSLLMKPGCSNEILIK